MKRSIAAALTGLAIFSGTASAQSVVTYHNSPARSGDYTVPGLTLAAAAKLHADTAFHASVTGNVYAQPLYWKPSGAKVGLLIVATESNAVYALNANTGAQVWKVQFAAAASRNLLPCGNIDPEGITGTPVIDPATGRLYLDALTSGDGKTAKQKSRLRPVSLSRAGRWMWNP
jgi:outer membrane protein assembly factor BamB